MLLCFALPQALQDVWVHGKPAEGGTLGTCSGNGARKMTILPGPDNVCVPTLWGAELQRFISECISGPGYTIQFHGASLLARHPSLCGHQVPHTDYRSQE